MEEDLIFLGMDIEKETANLVDKNESIITKGMNESELRAYHLGVDNTLSAMKCVLSDEEYLIFNVDVDVPTEMDISDLIDHIAN